MSELLMVLSCLDSILKMMLLEMQHETPAEWAAKAEFRRKTLEFWQPVLDLVMRGFKPALPPTVPPTP